MVLSLPGDPSSVAKELPQTVDPDVIPIGCLLPGSTEGIKHDAAGLRRLANWRRFLDILGASHAQVRSMLLTHFDHGKVSVLHADMYHAINVSAEAARVTIHLLLDGVVTTVYKNTKQRETREIPGYAVKLVEDRKLYADKTSKRPVARIHGGLHTLVPFAVEDGGRLGAHAQSFLRS
jgi:hypothetical protein